MQADMYVAIDRVSDRAGRTLGRTMDRRKTGSNRKERRVFEWPAWKRRMPLLSAPISTWKRVVVLTGQVRLYEQKLISGRIAWTTPGVVEIDNEIRVLSKLPVSDAAIERTIWEIVKSDERFREAQVTVRVNKGEVKLTGSFLGFSDPSSLKHSVAEIEGVVDIEISAAFLARQVQ